VTLAEILLCLGESGCAQSADGENPYEPTDVHAAGMDPTHRSLTAACNVVDVEPAQRGLRPAATFTSRVISHNVCLWRPGPVHTVACPCHGPAETYMLMDTESNAPV
jgi:hypothetical protein